MEDALEEPGSMHQLWINLSQREDGNIFANLSELMKKMYTLEALKLTDDESFDIVLPSDDAWQEKIYYRLVERQRKRDKIGEGMLDSFQYEEEIVKLHDWNIIPKEELTCDTVISTIGRKKQSYGPGPITWTVSDIAKAACLLNSPQINTTFEDEQEMRRVYTLIYDVFRYKSVLSQALNDVLFFQNNEKLKPSIPLVWLLFYDLYHRCFQKRETAVVHLAKTLFSQSGLTLVETALWCYKIKLAAAVSRLRIKYNALTLNELLPSHLRDERVIRDTSRNPVTCWVNNKKFKSPNEISKEIGNTLKLTMVNDINDLGPANFKWDKHCPLIVTFHSSIRTELAKSSLVRNHKLVVQDKSFCLGPATFWKIVCDLQLSGSVIQTHVNSPRSTAYLATLLAQNEKIKKIMAFSAGRRKNEYESYFNQLGMTNVLIFSDSLIDMSPDSITMEEVVAVFATPPNSYSAVNDPIDLVCSRGGDLSMLEVLTESEETLEGKNRVNRILEEQRKTLKFAMSKPQIQFVLYETHSELQVENDDMVQKTIKEINRVAKLHHATLKGGIATEVKEINNNENAKAEENPLTNQDSNQSIESFSSESKLSAESSEEDLIEKIQVPDTDLFDTPDLPSLCPNEESCLNLTKEGCYLALLQRKQVIRLDNKYMIQMAEQRGLFGNDNAPPVKPKKSQKKKVEAEEKSRKSKRKLKDTEVIRIAAPTHSFLRHHHDESYTCHRCRQLQEEIKQQSIQSHHPPYRKWWTETTRHITALRANLVHKNILPPHSKSKPLNAKTVVSTLVHETSKIDEIAVKYNTTSNIPIFPKLKLSRNKQQERVALSIPITIVTFPIDGSPRSPDDLYLCKNL